MVMEIIGHQNWTICSGINTSALITTKPAINQTIAGKRCWNTVGHELGLYTCAWSTRMMG